MTTGARALHLKHQQQPLLCKSRIEAPTGALGIRLFIRLFKIRLNSPNTSINRSLSGIIKLAKLGGFCILVMVQKSAAPVSTTTAANRNPKCKPAEFVNQLVCFFGQSITTAMILNIHWVSLVLQCFLLIDCKAKQVANIVDKCARFVMGKTSWSVCFGFLIYKCRK